MKYNKIEKTVLIKSENEKFVSLHFVEIRIFYILS